MGQTESFGSRELQRCSEEHNLQFDEDFRTKNLTILNDIKDGEEIYLGYYYCKFLHHNFSDYIAYFHWFVTTGTYFIEFGSGLKNIDLARVNINKELREFTPVRHINAKLNPEIRARIIRVLGMKNFSMCLRNSEHVANFIIRNQWFSTQMVEINFCSPKTFDYSLFYYCKSSLEKRNTIKLVNTPPSGITNTSESPISNFKPTEPSNNKPTNFFKQFFSLFQGPEWPYNPIEFDQNQWLKHNLKFNENVRASSLSILNDIKDGEELHLGYTKGILHNDFWNGRLEYQHWFIKSGRYFIEFGPPEEYIKNGENFKLSFKFYEYKVYIHAQSRDYTPIETKNGLNSKMNAEIRKRIKKVLGMRNYSLVLRNSEHLVRFIIENKWFSSQVDENNGVIFNYYKKFFLENTKKYINTFPSY